MARLSQHVLLTWKVDNVSINQAKVCCVTVETNPAIDTDVTKRLVSKNSKIGLEHVLKNCNVCKTKKKFVVKLLLWEGATT